MPPPRRKHDRAILSTLGANIEAARKARGLTQEKLAELADLHPRAIQKLEAGEANPPSTTLFRLQAVLGCPWERLAPPLGQ